MNNGKAIQVQDLHKNFGDIYAVLGGEEEGDD